MARYEAGETLASIARTYDCSPPAISYIVSRNREQPASETPVTPVAEPQLIKAPGNGAAPLAATVDEPTVVPSPAAAVRREPAADMRPNGGNGEQRAKLHLSLGNGNHTVAGGNSHNGHAGPDTAGAGLRPDRAGVAAPRPPQPAVGERSSVVAPPRDLPPFDAGRNGRELAEPEMRSVQQPRDADRPRKDNAAFIDQELRTRVDSDIAAFLAAFDAALAEDTQASRFGLREATQRLLRAGARTRIELERLEARIPLPARDGASAPEQASWRYR